MDKYKKYLDPARSTRRWITLGLILGGAVGGALFGVALTALGKIVAGAPPADMANYIWNARVFGVFGAVLTPIVTWSTLRRVPLWRAVAEPVVASVLGAGLGVLLGSPLAFLAFGPLAAVAAVARLELRHRPKTLTRVKPADVSHHLGA